jgi:hypothetical protein
MSDFSISASPSSQTVAAGASTAYILALAAIGGFNASVTLTVSGVPAGATAFISPSTQTAAFYVSASSGNDAWSGLLAAPNGGGTDGPFQTIGAAQTAMRAGVVLRTVVRAGTYSISAGRTFTSADNNTTWVAYPGETPIFEGSTTGGLTFNGTTGMSFLGLTIQNMRTNGIVFNGESYMTWRWNNVLTSLGAAMAGGISNSLIDSNTFNGQSPGNVGGNAYSTVNLYNSSSSNIVSHNYFTNCEGGAVGFSNGPTQAGCANNLIDRNEAVNVCTNVVDYGAYYIYDPSHSGTGNRITNNIANGNGSSVTPFNTNALYLDDLTSNVLVSGNVVRAWIGRCFLIHGGNNNTVQGNIFDMSASSLLGYYQASATGSIGQTGNQFSHNLVYSASTFPSALWVDQATPYGQAPLAVSDNLYFSATGASIPNTIFVDGAPVYGDPLFASPSTGNYAMPSTSPAFLSAGFTALATDQGLLAANFASPLSTLSVATSGSVAASTYTLTITAVSGVLTHSTTVALVVTSGGGGTAPVWPTLALPSAQIGSAYSATWDLSPATAPTTYSLVSGTLPPGIALTNVSADTGKLAGIPTTAGTYTFVLRATNSAGTADSSTLSLTVTSPIPALLKVGGVRILPDTDASRVNTQQFATKDNQHFVSLQAPDTLAANVALTLPPALGGPGAVLTDVAGTGVLTLVPGATGNIWVKEVPSGTLNGTNTTFGLSFTPTPGSLSFLCNIDQRECIDFTISGNTISMAVAPKLRDTGWFFARYQH